VSRRRAADHRPPAAGWLLALVLVAATLLHGAAPASAHASLVGASPPDRSSVETAPAKVMLRFDENIRAPSVVIVTGPGGRRVDHGATAVVDNTAGVHVTVTDPGRYTVAYRVLSADGHPVAGETTFGYRGAGAGAGNGSGSAPTSPASTADGGSSATGWVAGGVVVALLAAGALLLSGRLPGRRRQPPASDTGGDPTSGSTPSTPRNEQ
jgi:methionine-rich copper-binding protein CopC